MVSSRWFIGWSRKRQWSNPKLHFGQQKLTLELLEDRTLLSFQGAVAYNTGADIAALAVGDFNGDGIPDIVTASPRFQNSVNLLLGNGDGTFQAPRSVPTNEIARGIAVGDFTGTGKLDVAIAGVQDVVVLLGNGDGTFQNPVHYYAGSTSSIAVGDLRHNGILDLVVTNRTPGLVGVFLGRGDGTFDNVRFFSAGQDANVVAVGDFNEDGKADLVVANTFTNQVNVLLGNGDGTFQPPVSHAVATNPVALAVGELAGDGHQDVAVGLKNPRETTGNGVDLLLGNGDGSFREGGTLDAGQASTALAIADLNGDGLNDLAVIDVGQLYDSTLKVFLGNGDGTFQRPSSYEPGPTAVSLAVADLTGDHALGMVVGTGSTASVFLNRGDGTFPSATKYVAGLDPASVAVGDFQRDGIVDIATANFGADTVSLLFGNGDGTFQAPVNLRVGSSPRQLIVTDLRHDGRLDLVLIAGSGVNVLLGNGDGTFQDPVTYVIPGNYPATLVVADLNGDSFPDLVTLGTGRMVSVLLNRGNGTFQDAVTFGLSTDETPSALAVGDFYHHGILDIAVTAGKMECDPKYGCTLVASSINVFRGNGDGTFQAPMRQSIFPLFPPSRLRAGDFNGDGTSDLVLGLDIFLGNGDGTFRDAGGLNTGFFGLVGDVAVADLDHRGTLDLVVANDTSATVSIFRGVGDGTFQRPVSYVVGLLADAVAVGDFNGDGFDDLVIANQGGRGSLTVLLNAGDGTAPGGNAATRFSDASSAGVVPLGILPEVNDKPAWGSGWRNPASSTQGSAQTEEDMDHFWALAGTEEKDAAASGEPNARTASAHPIGPLRWAHAMSLETVPLWREDAFES
jgi:hypothetical protein